MGQKQSPEDQGKRKANSILAYSGIGFQMLATILLFVFIGFKLDEAQESDSSIWTLIFTLLGVFIGFYFMIKAFLKLGK